MLWFQLQHIVRLVGRHVRDWGAARLPVSAGVWSGINSVLVMKSSGAGTSRSWPARLGSSKTQRRISTDRALCYLQLDQYCWSFSPTEVFGLADSWSAWKQHSSSLNRLSVSKKNKPSPKVNCGWNFWHKFQCLYCLIHRHRATAKTALIRIASRGKNT